MQKYKLNLDFQNLFFIFAEQILDKYADKKMYYFNLNFIN